MESAAGVVVSSDESSGSPVYGYVAGRVDVSDDG